MLRIVKWVNKRLFNLNDNDNFSICRFLNPTLDMVETWSEDHNPDNINCKKISEGVTTEKKFGKKLLIQ